MAIRSHVQNSKFIIKQFKISDSNGCVRALNILDGSISDKGPMEIGTQIDYYDSDTEQYLSNNYESPFALVVNKFLNCEIDELSPTFSENDIQSVKKFLIMLFIRKPSLLDESYDKTVIAKALGIKPSPSTFVRLLEQTNLVDELLGDLEIVAICNKNSNNKKFVSSIRGFVAFGNSKKQIMWWLPISPDFGICFVDKTSFAEIFQNSSYVTIAEDEMVEFFNDKLAKATIDCGETIIFSSTDLELNRIKTTAYFPNALS